MILTGEPIKGEEAAKHHLANHAVEEEELEDFTMKLAKKISEKSIFSINNVMKLISYSTRENFKDGVAKEAELFGEVFQTEDAKKAFKPLLKRENQNSK